MDDFRCGRNGLRSLGELSLSDDSSSKRSAPAIGLLYQTDVDDVTELIRRAAACADQRVTALVIVEIFRAEGSDRDQPVGAGLAQLDEQAGARDAGDAALKLAPMRSAR